MVDIVEEGELVVSLADVQAGGDGSLLLSDASVSGSRENSNISGIGNEGPTVRSTGIPTYTVDIEAYVSEAAAELLKTMVRDDERPGGTLYDGADILTADITDMAWNSFEVSASDEGDYTVSITADCGVDFV